MSRLYEITAEYRQFMELIESGDIPEEAITDTLESINGEFEAKVDNIACVIKNLRALCAQIKAEENALTERRKKKEREIERLQEYITRAMEVMDVRSVETARNKLSFRCSAALLVTDEEALLEWAKKNAPDTVNVTVTEKLNASKLKELIRTTNIPYAVIEKRNNLQIK